MSREPLKPPGPPPEPRARSSAAAAPAAPQAPAPAPLSLAELQALPAKELRHMLAERGVSPGTATEKAELAQWAFQHQDLPAVRSAASAAPAAGAGREEATKSVAELRQMSVAELREMLAQRGVSEGSATEKGELVQWVFQHQNLPVLRASQQQRKKTRQRGRWSFFGRGDPSDPYDSPREEAKQRGPEHERLEGLEPERLEGNEGQRLLEGSAEALAAAPARRCWPWAAAGGLGVAVLAIVGTVAANDARQAATE
uniref:SAP domain-containing protein n=1 Tax=Pyrodinium bahamense TaxID=73915 RepID=A0A7S0A4Y4_9DINO